MSYDFEFGSVAFSDNYEDFYGDILADLEDDEESIFEEFSVAEDETLALSAIDEWLEYFKTRLDLYERFRERVREAYALRELREQ